MSSAPESRPELPDRPGLIGAMTGALAEPTRRVGAGWIAAFAVLWLAIWMAQLTPVQLLLPDQVQHAAGGRGWLGDVAAFGIISGISGVCALLAYPLTGAFSDRTRSRFGRRRPWIAGGALLFAVSLALLGFQHELVIVGVLWSLAIIGFCVLTAALTATISDQVPVGQRGFVSGWLSAPQALGLVLGVAVVSVLALSTTVAYLGLAVVLVLLVLPFLRIPDAVLPSATRMPLSPRALLESVWISPRAHPDFGWTLLGRILVNYGNALGTGLLLYFLEFGLHERSADDDLLVLILIYTAFVVVASLVGGRLSDLAGRRRSFVFLASTLQGIAALLLAFAPSLTVAFASAALLGLGYGCFLAVDQALATQVLPDPRSRGKDLGIMNIALAFPQATAPLIGAGLVVLSGGFTALFLVSGVTAFLGAVAVSRVRGVR